MQIKITNFPKEDDRYLVYFSLDTAVNGTVVNQIQLLTVQL